MTAGRGVCYEGKPRVRMAESNDHRITITMRMIVAYPVGYFKISHRVLYMGLKTASSIREKFNAWRVHLWSITYGVRHFREPTVETCLLCCLAHTHVIGFLILTWQETCAEPGLAFPSNALFYTKKRHIFPLA